ncbi:MULTISPECIES: hypothetical protein [Aneurinibacillus]|uniref:hypothetical protein n=1 Tax=Aneurinibacillus TaxID=55079 RepID=UPI000A3FA308|nr:MULTISPECIES: hypothetical protein [Aneurinibacillus]MED0674364.1 hypothetical protein [Aneurinibacillus thermoaerophilus]MED0678383.1 hypothetical protein [Aneurinibacillus thermoaerophilus]MED0736093.1 hypothetical protein [Aneurinibacillus thermoaerophilus]MED0756937.1 hypothetical protein [Aneurinibacillus thermoaerophilus]MED0761758.1 hypothetical protein [Aneurinibacillus thermoaerophilus]
MKQLCKHFVCIFLLLGCDLPATAQYNMIPKFIINSQPTTNVKELINSSTIIAFGKFDAANQKQPTGKRVEGGELVNFVQSFHVKKFLKGTGPRSIRVLSTGIEPLPDPSHPLNKVYPGPMAEGEYVCFLTSVAGTHLYTIIGGWQGVYPVHEGKVISLEQSGYSEFNQLTLQELEKKIQAAVFIERPYTFRPADFLHHVPRT